MAASPDDLLALFDAGAHAGRTRRIRWGGPDRTHGRRDHTEERALLMSRTAYGTEVGPSQWMPLRSIISEPETSLAGNLILRVGRENNNRRSWHYTEHVVLTPEEAREYIAKLVALIPVDAAERPLPRVTVHDVTVETAVLIAEFHGERAVNLAESLVDKLVNEPNGGGASYSIDVSDDRCGECGQTFSSEARYETDDGWVCPVCGGDPRLGP